MKRRKFRYPDGYLVTAMVSSEIDLFYGPNTHPASYLPERGDGEKRCPPNHPLNVSGETAMVSGYTCASL